MRKLAANQVTREEIAFDEGEPPTRRSDVSLVDYAREAEALLANGLDVESAQMLRATMAPPDAQVESSAPERLEDDVRLDWELRLAASPEEIEWFPLSEGAGAILGVLARPLSVREALARAGLHHDVGLEHVRTLLEIGLVALV